MRILRLNPPLPDPTTERVARCRTDAEALGVAQDFGARHLLDPLEGDGDASDGGVVQRVLRPIRTGPERSERGGGGDNVDLSAGDQLVIDDRPGAAVRAVDAVGGCHVWLLVDGALAGCRRR